MKIDVIAKRYWFLGFSLVLLVASIVCISVFGLKPGIDLKGGAQWQIAFSNKDVTESDLRSFLNDLIKADVLVQQVNDESFLLRLPDLNENEHQVYLSAISQRFGEVNEKSFSSIGPTIGAELRNKSIWAIIAVLFGISLYVAWAFRKVSRPIKSWKYGIATLVSLFHDVAIPAGMLALLGYTNGVEIDTNSIVALLVVMGFSVHDTIVVFDRIRENLLISRGKNFSLKDTINFSIHETFVRSVNTSLTLVLVLLALLIFGPESLFYFVLTILVGTIFGTYSSIFLASPLLYMWQGQNKQK